MIKLISVIIALSLIYLGYMKLTSVSIFDLDVLLFIGDYQIKSNILTLIFILVFSFLFLLLIFKIINYIFNIPYKLKSHFIISKERNLREKLMKVIICILTNQVSDSKNLIGHIINDVKKIPNKNQRFFLHKDFIIISDIYISGKITKKIELLKELAKHNVKHRYFAYKQLAFIYFESKEIELAKEYATKALTINAKAEDLKKIIKICNEEQIINK